MPVVRVLFYFMTIDQCIPYIALRQFHKQFFFPLQALFNMQISRWKMESPKAVVSFASTVLKQQSAPAGP